MVLPFEPPLDERPVAANEQSEIDVLRAQNAELQTRLRQHEARDDVTTALRSAGARSPELLFEAARDTLAFSDDGSVENAEAMVAEMKQRFPEQFGSPTPPSIDGGAGRGGQPVTLTKDALSKMKPDEIARLDWATVKQVLSS